MPLVGLDLSGTVTVQPGKYDLSRVNIEALDAEIRKFIEHLLRDKHVMYDWGYDYFWTCAAPFRADYENRTIYKEGTDIQVSDSDWVGCDSTTLHQHLVSIFEGEWGPTSTDIILRMENSGIRVDLCNTSKFGPPNPQEFMEALRKMLNT